MIVRALWLSLVGALLAFAAPAAFADDLPPTDAFLHTLILTSSSGGMDSPLFLGRTLFELDWAVAPGPKPGFDGLGPLFSRLSCDGCHTRAGRGEPPRAPGDPMVSMVVRLSVPGAGPNGAPKPDPVYGEQLDRNAVPGVPVEGRAFIDYVEQPGNYRDGEAYSLRAPKLRFADLGYGALGPETMTSARVAPALIGLSLIEAVPATTIETLAQEQARGGLVHGRPNMVWDIATKTQLLGRFGWKAGQPTLRQQNGSALNLDIGITNPLYPESSCTANEIECRTVAAAAPRHPKIGADFLDAITAYIAHLAPPPQRNPNDAKVRHGAGLFSSLGCIACHRPSLATGNTDEPATTRMTFHPYTDLLVHDMGAGLADGRPEYAADGRSWRTAPLWGLGLIGVVNGHEFLLHDGRARGPAEAILWHGGEAETAKEKFRALSKDERADLIAFLMSL